MSLTQEELQLKSSELELKGALLSTGLIVPVKVSSRPWHLDMQCRPVPGQEKTWLKALEIILQTAETNQVSLHICRKYLLKDGLLAFGWCIQVTAEDADMLTIVVDTLKGALEKAPPPQEAKPAPAPPPPPAEPDPVVARTQRRPRIVPDDSDQPAPTRNEHQDQPVVVMAPVIDDEGKERVEVIEMQLPHVHGELNVPTPGGKGARAYSDKNGSRPGRRG